MPVENKLRVIRGIFANHRKSWTIDLSSVLKQGNARRRGCSPAPDGGTPAAGRPSQKPAARRWSAKAPTTAHRPARQPTQHEPHAKADERLKRFLRSNLGQRLQDRLRHGPKGFGHRRGPRRDTLQGLAPGIPHGAADLSKEFCPRDETFLK